ncbi:hypothetical protein BU16DRAFT_537387 [Lophium mytilinum]|uniref:Uncharacterized protein n=1 Tax=Lophium mytilinum TaxID=390894 RepID=A0A6A6QZ73_9PEZI|nr:hypothetical protein BU16DRAFT_537387 [Lophium mytilinum]
MALFTRHVAVFLLSANVVLGNPVFMPKEMAKESTPINWGLVPTGSGLVPTGSGLLPTVPTGLSPTPSKYILPKDGFPTFGLSLAHGQLATSLPTTSPCLPRPSSAPPPSPTTQWGNLPMTLTSLPTTIPILTPSPATPANPVVSATTAPTAGACFLQLYQSRHSIPAANELSEFLGVQLWKPPFTDVAHNLAFAYGSVLERDLAGVGAMQLGNETWLSSPLDLGLVELPCAGQYDVRVTFDSKSWSLLSPPTQPPATVKLPTEWGVGNGPGFEVPATPGGGGIVEWRRFDVTFDCGFYP